MGTKQYRAALGTLNADERHPLLPALAAQFIGLIAVGLPTLLFAPELLRHGLLLAMLQGGVAALVSRWIGMPAWWLAIHLLFLPLAVVARSFELPAWLWATALVLTLLVFWRTDRSRVPLYLSSEGAANALLGLLPAGACRVIDLGCGDGAVLRHLARRRPESRFIGIEHAPLPWLWARVCARSHSNLEIHLGNFWRHILTDYDLVYAYLSPAPMPRLWAKACTEMKAGALLVSNSFVVPGRAETQRIAVNDKAMTYFYVYQVPAPAV